MRTAEVCKVTTNLSDDSDMDNEERHVLKGSSDGSQYGSDSGMGDSLMNTLASECADGMSKTLTESPVNNIVEKVSAANEGSDGGDTLCGEASPPSHDHDIEERDDKVDHIAQTEPIRGRQCERDKPLHVHHIVQNEDTGRARYDSKVTSNTFTGKPLQFEKEEPIEIVVPASHIVRRVPSLLDQDTNDGSAIAMPNDRALTEDKKHSGSRPYLPEEYLLPEHPTSRDELLGYPTPGMNLPVVLRKRHSKMVHPPRRLCSQKLLPRR